MERRVTALLGPVSHLCLLFAALLVPPTAQSFAEVGNAIHIEETARSLTISNGLIALSMDKQRNYLISDFSETDGPDLLGEVGLTYRTYPSPGEGIWISEYGQPRSYRFIEQEISRGESFVSIVIRSRTDDMELSKEVRIEENSPYAYVAYKIKLSTSRRLGPVLAPKMHLSGSLARFSAPVWTTGGSLDAGGVKAELVTMDLTKAGSSIYSWAALTDLEQREGVFVIPLRAKEFEEHPPAARFEPDTQRVLVDFKVPALGSWEGSLSHKIGEVFKTEILLAPYSRELEAKIIEQYPRLAKTVSSVQPTAVTARRLMNTETLVVWEELTTKKVYRATPIPDSLIAANGIEISSAKNEWECFQIVLTPKQRLDSLRVDIDALVHDSGHTIRDVQWFPVGYVNIAEALPRGPIGLTPDILAPPRPLALQKDVNQPLIVRIKTPGDAIPGEYRGLMKLLDGGTVLSTIPISLRVYDFALPTRTSLKSAFELYTWRLVRPGDPELVKRFLRNMSEHRISVGAICGPQVQRHAGGVKVDTTTMDFWLTHCIDQLHMNNFYLPYTLFGVGSQTRAFLGAQPLSEEWSNLMTSYLEFMVPHLKRNGWYDETTYFIWDEPDPDGADAQQIYGMIGECARLIRSVDPKSTIHVTAALADTRLERNWPNITRGIRGGIFYGRQFLRDPRCSRGEFRKENETLWWSFGGELYRRLMTEQPLTSRLIPWHCYLNEIEGIEMWAINEWNDPREAADDLFSPRIDNLQRFNIPASSKRFGGVLIYQDQDGNPVDSLRWENLRDGVEDYEYFMIAEALIENLAKTGEEELFAPLADILKQLKSCDDFDDGRLQRLRSALACEIETLCKALP